MADPNLSELGRTWPCAACTTADKLCTANCIFAPLFPPDRTTEFTMVHKVFGEMNSRKLLAKLPPEHRKDAADSLVYEAEARLRDPLNGCVGTITSLQKRLEGLKQELLDTEAEIARYGAMMPDLYETDDEDLYGLDLSERKYVRGKNMKADHDRIMDFTSETFKAAARDSSDEDDIYGSDTDKSMKDKIARIAWHMARMPGSSKSAADHSSDEDDDNDDSDENKV